MRRGALLTVALLQLGAGCLLGPGPAQARGSLHVSDVPLSGRARQVGIVMWQERPAIWAFVTQPSGDALLHVFVMRGQSIQQVALWPLPWATAWVQPMARRGAHGKLAQQDHLRRALDLAGEIVQEDRHQILKVRLLRDHDRLHHIL